MLFTFTYSDPVLIIHNSEYNNNKNNLPHPLNTVKIPNHIPLFRLEDFKEYFLV